MVVIEIIGAEGKTPRFERSELPLIRIGRALDNDVIIDDPYIDAHHLTLDVSDGGVWQAMDLGTQNGSTRGRHAISAATITSGDELTIGKTRIRFFRTDHRVTPALSLRDLEHVLLNFGSLPLLVTLLTILTAMPCLLVYLNSVGNEIKLNTYISAALAGVVASLGVAAFWSFIARLLRGEPRFRVLLNLTMISALVTGAFAPILNVVYYNLPDAPGRSETELLLSAVLLAGYVYLVLLLSTRLRPRMNQIIAGVLALGTVATFAITKYSGRDEFRRFPQYDDAVYSPMFLLRAGEAPQAYQSRLQDVFEQADALAAEDTEDDDLDEDASDEGF